MSICANVNVSQVVGAAAALVALVIRFWANRTATKGLRRERRIDFELDALRELRGR